MRVRIPDGVIGVKPMPKPGWHIETVKAKYDRPYKMFHNSVTEGVREVTWTGKLPDDNYDEFVLSTYLIDELKPDTILYFPVGPGMRKGRAPLDRNPGGRQVRPPICPNPRRA